MGRRFNTYGGNYSTYVRTKAENETNQMKAYNKQQDEIKHIKEYVWQPLGTCGSASDIVFLSIVSSPVPEPTPTWSSRPSLSKRYVISSHFY